MPFPVALCGKLLTFYKFRSGAQSSALPHIFDMHVKARSAAGERKMKALANRKYQKWQVNETIANYLLPAVNGVSDKV
jgi:hypothetical protein